MIKVRFYLNFKEDKRVSMNIYALEHIKNLKKYNKKVKVSYFKPKIPKYFDFIPLFWKMRIARYLLYKKQIKNLPRVDVAHVIDQQYAHIVENLNAKKKIITVHDLQPIIFEKKHKKNPILFKYSINHLDKFDNVITISKRSKRDILKYTNLKKKKISIFYQTPSNLLISNIHDKEFINKFIKDKKKITIITFSSIFYKNFKTSFKIFKKLRKNFKNLYFLNFGDLPIEIENKFKKNIIKLPYLNEIEHNNIFKSSDLLLFPSSYEGYGRPCMEAMGSNLPVVSSNFESIKEILGNAGIYCKPFNVNCFVSKITKLIINRKYYNNIKKKLFKRKRMFDEKKYYKDLMYLYKN